MASRSGSLRVRSWVAVMRLPRQRLRNRRVVVGNVANAAKGESAAKGVKEAKEEGEGIAASGAITGATGVIGARGVINHVTAQENQISQAAEIAQPWGGYQRQSGQFWGLWPQGPRLGAAYLASDRGRAAGGEPLRQAWW
ncbi:hypothetical protein CCP3SC15_930002 [Gammaproteobacteria bacterium]